MNVRVRFGGEQMFAHLFLLVALTHNVIKRKSQASATDRFGDGDSRAGQRLCQSRCDTRQSRNKNAGYPGFGNRVYFLGVMTHNGQVRTLMHVHERAFPIFEVFAQLAA